MGSRVERYYDKVEGTKKRSVKNVELYKTIYEDETYSNIEGVVETTKTNEIDIRKIKELLQKQEEAEQRKNQLVKRNLEIPDMESLDNDDETGNYDIRDILSKAKENQEELEDNKLRSLKDIDFDELKQRLKAAEKYTEEEQGRDLKELQDLVNTINGTNNTLNNLADRDLSLDMFSDLVASTKDLTKEQTDAIKRIIAEAKRIDDENEENLEEEIQDIDKSFYTNTLKLKKKDFEENDEDEESSSVGLKVFMIILFIIVAVIFVIVGYNILK